MSNEFKPGQHVYLANTHKGTITKVVIEEKKHTCGFQRWYSIIGTKELILDSDLFVKHSEAKKYLTDYYSKKLSEYIKEALKTFWLLRKMI